MKNLKGMLLALAAGCCWGLSGTMGQYMFDIQHTDAAALTVIRMISSGIVLLCITFFCNPSDLKKVWEKKKASAVLVMFAVFGLAAVQYSYMKAIDASNAGTATALQYTGEVLILLEACIAQRRLPKKSEGFGVLLALTGIFLIATHGSINNMVLSKEALFWGGITAFTLMLYTIMPARLIRCYGSKPVTGYGMILGGVVLWAIFRPDFGVFNIWGIAALAVIVLVGTVFAYTAFLHAASEIGSVPAALLASVEVVSAPFFSALLLGSKFTVYDCGGFLCMLLMAVMLALPELRKTHSGAV